MSGKERVLLLLVSASVAACGPDQPRSTDPAELAAKLERPSPQQDAPQPLADPPAPPPAAPSLPGLLPLSEAQIAPGLGPGASCALNEDGRTLMVATAGGAIVNDRGTLVHLKPEARDWNTLVEGGQFVAGELRIEVDPGAVLARGEKTVERDSSVSIMRGRRGFSVSHGPRWSCDSRKEG